MVHVRAAYAGRCRSNAASAAWTDHRLLGVLGAPFHSNLPPNIEHLPASFLDKYQRVGTTRGVGLSHFSGAVMLDTLALAHSKHAYQYAKTLGGSCQGGTRET